MATLSRIGFFIQLTENEHAEYSAKFIVVINMVDAKSPSCCLQSSAINIIDAVTFNPKTTTTRRRRAHHPLSSSGRPPSLLCCQATLYVRYICILLSSTGKYNSTYMTPAVDDVASHYNVVDH
eukprot:scaffold113708_cov21-Prasinocladus_malaysianus.AAC.1